MPGCETCGQVYVAQFTAAPVIHWGVDSTEHVDATFSGPPPIVTGVPFFELVRMQAGNKAPEFWGRYIGSLTAIFNLTLSEVLYLASKSCRILLIYNGQYMTATNVATSGPPGRQNGANAANDAVASARNLPIPGNRTVWIYCNIESTWNPTRDFIQGWFDTMRTSPYGGGVYGTDSTRQYGNPLTTFGAEFCAVYSPTASPPEYLYNTQPGTAMCNIPPQKRFNPSVPCGSAPLNKLSVIYQLAQNCSVNGAPLPNPPPGESHQMDPDLANKTGFDSMWAPKIRLFACWFRTTASSSYGVGPIGSISTDNGTTWSVPAVMTGSPSDPINTAVWDQFGGCVCRGSGNSGVLDLYATAHPSIQRGASWVGFYVKRYTFDGRAWTGPVTIVSRTVSADNIDGISNPTPFRNFVGNKRALTWVESRKLVRPGDGGSMSHTVIWSWVDTGQTVTINGRTYRKWNLTQNAQDTLDYFGTARNQLPINSSITSVSITAATTYGGANTDVITSVADNGTGGVTETHAQLLTQGAVASGNQVFASGTNNYSSSGFGIGTGGVASLYGIWTAPSGFTGDAWKLEGTGSPVTPANAAANTTITNVAITLSAQYIYYCDLDSSGNLSGTPVTVFDNVKRASLVYGRFNADDNPVLAAVQDNGGGNYSIAMITRTGSTWGTPSLFSLSDDTDVDAQFLGQSPAWKAALSIVLLGDHGAFNSLRKAGAGGDSSPVYSHRKRNFPGVANVTDSLDLRTIDGPIDLSIPQTRYWDVAEGQLAVGDTALFEFNTDNSPGGTRVDVWTLVGKSDGSRWYAYHIAEDDLFGNFYSRSMDWGL